jgi:hypothetical protein
MPASTLLAAAPLLAAARKTTTTDHVFGILVIPPLLVIIYALTMLGIHWRRASKGTNRAQVWQLALGNRQAKVIMLGFVVYGVLLLIGVAIFHNKMT